MAQPAALAVAAHPDDIELMMGGTLILLGEAGFDLHYMNVANGSMGSESINREALVRQRTEEAREAARTLGATFHEPVVDDLAVFYDPAIIRRVCAVVRRVRPTILLVQSPQDYMEDHMSSTRIAVTAAFCRGMRNFVSDPPLSPIAEPVTVYHALPWGLRDPLRRRVKAGQYVDVGGTLDQKRDALACHKSQKEWLDVSQGLDSYLITMEDTSRAVGKLSGRFEHAEGWRRHLHAGFCDENADPLSDALGEKCFTDQAYEEGLNLG